MHLLRRISMTLSECDSKPTYAESCKYCEKTNMKSLPLAYNLCQLVANILQPAVGFQQKRVFLGVRQFSTDIIKSNYKRFLCQSSQMILSFVEDFTDKHDTETKYIQTQNNNLWIKYCPMWGIEPRSRSIIYLNLFLWLEAQGTQAQHVLNNNYVIDLRGPARLTPTHCMTLSKYHRVRVCWRALAVVMLSLKMLVSSLIYVNQLLIIK